MLNRRDFLSSTAALAVTGTSLSLCAESGAAAGSVKPEQRNPHPYQNINWESVFQIHTTTHGHATTQSMLDRFLARGFELITLSNYYPSAPYYPLDKITLNYYKLHHDHPVMVKGKLTPGPFDWNTIIKPWADELDEHKRKRFPFKEGGKAFTSYPDNLLQAPNAEHHSFTDASVHICAPGSNYASGTFDAHNDYQTMSRGGYHFGTGLPWREAFDKMFEGLIYPDGGGVTINHPMWSRLKFDKMMELLDYDGRVLGIEAFNMSAGDKKRYPWCDKLNEQYWDYALKNGRQCFGFFVPDWGVTEGTNILIVQERSVHACLQAYRQGNWYGAIKGRHILDFKKIAFDGQRLEAVTDKPARFQVIAASGVVFETKADRFTFTVKAGDRKKYVFLRIKAFATDDSGEIIFSQPFMLS
ncbi:MAG: hypothetical protein PHQ75_08135 [Thermoguttaceae bacterium]|nr:hypothetical protein [Thermoguttaceae bacterium]